MGRKGSVHQTAHECNLKDFTRQKAKKKNTHINLKIKKYMPLPTVSFFIWGLAQPLHVNPEASYSLYPAGLLQGLGLQFNRFPCDLWLSIGLTGPGTLENRQSLRNTLEPGEEEKVIKETAQACSNDRAHPVHL